MANDLNLGMKCIKYMLFAMTLMFVLAAALLVSIGTTINCIYHDFDYFLDGKYYSPATLLVIIGIIMLFVSLFGCLGAIKESTCMINFFALLLTLVLIVEIGTAIAAYSLRHGTNTMLRSAMSLGLTEYYDDSEVRAEMDFLQSHLNCCGVDSKYDWEGMLITSNNTVIPDNKIPYSCCEVYIQHPIESNLSMSCQKYYSTGCLHRLDYIIVQSAVLLGTGAITIILIQVIGIIFSVMLAKQIRRAKTERELKKMEVREQIARARIGTEKSVDETPVLYLPSGGQTTA